MSCLQPCFLNTILINLRTFFTTSLEQYEKSQDNVVSFHKVTFIQWKDLSLVLKLCYIFGGRVLKCPCELVIILFLKCHSLAKWNPCESLFFTTDKRFLFLPPIYRKSSPSRKDLFSYQSIRVLSNRNIT